MIRSIAEKKTMANKVGRPPKAEKSVKFTMSLPASMYAGLMCAPNRGIQKILLALANQHLNK